MCSFVTDLKVDEGWRLPLLGSASFPLTWGDALTSLCDCKEQNKTRVIPQRRASVQSGACFEWITPTLSPASLFRVLFMISSRRCADQTEISALVFQLDCELSVTFWTLYRWYFSLFGLTFFLSRRSCSSFWKCFSLSMRWRSASSRAFASASSLWNKEDTNMKQV